MSISFFPVLILMMFSTHPLIAEAGKSYTPDQLRKMIQRGNFPKQGDVTTKKESANYAECIALLRAIKSSIAEYPSQTIVSTNTERMEKIWTNDGAVTVTCSANDRTIIITSAPYL